MKIKRRPHYYLSYLLRLWREERNGQVIWRASLESVQTKEQRSFAGIEELFNFLYHQIQLASDLTTDDH